MSRSLGGPDLVTIYTTMGLLQAEVIKGKLESAGIPVLLSYESAGPVFGITVDGLGEVEVQVPREFEAEALDLIEPLEDGHDEVSDDEWEWDEGEELADEG